MPRKLTKPAGRRRRHVDFGQRTGQALSPLDASSLTVYRSLSGQICPDKWITPMKFVAAYALGAGAGTSVSRTFSQNSVYDPDVTGVGGTVTGFALMTLMYTRFRVIESKIKATCQVSDDTVVLAAISAAPTDGGSTLPATQVAAFRYAKPEALKVLPANGYGPPAILRDSIATVKLHGSALYDDPNMYGIGSSDPVDQFYWSVGFSDAGGAAFGVNVIAEIEYLVEWTLPRVAPA